MERKLFMPDRPQREFQAKLQEAMDRYGIGACILTSAESIFYATGYISCLYGRCEAPGTDIVVVPNEGRVSLIVSQFTQGGAELQTKGEVDVISYPTYMYIEDYYNPQEIDKPEESDTFNALDMAMELADANIGDKLLVGFEGATLPYNQSSYLIEHYGYNRLKSVEEMMTEIRKIKLPWEIDVLRAAAVTEEEMMNRTMRLTEEGMTEADINRLWWTAAYEISGGHEIFNVRQAHSVGPDFWCTIMAREKPLKRGDLVRLDGGITLYGYMSDLGRTYAIGNEVTPRKQEIFDTLVKAYDVGVSMMAPGVKMSDIFNAVMKVCHENALPDFVRGHVGHTIGLGPGEDKPIISGGCDEILLPGMVLCIEVPYYSSENGSYNVEDTLVITENGHEMFTNINRSLFIS